MKKNTETTIMGYIGVTMPLLLQEGSKFEKHPLQAQGDHGLAVPGAHRLP